MSSLAASRADNFYFPPEWEPSMGSISKFQGSKGKNQYEQYGIIRFELPFDAWCLKCNLHMSKGLRFNATKERAGNYFSTTIWTFTTKCYDCNQQFIIKTNPQASTYDFEEGLRKHEQDYDIGTEDGVVELKTAEERVQLDQDPMFRLQHIEEDKFRTKSIKQNLMHIQKLQESTQINDYDMNALLRSKNRTLKKRERKMMDDGRNLGLSIPLLDHSEEDTKKAKELSFRLKKKDSSKILEKQKFVSLQNQSIYDKSCKDDSSLRKIQHLVNNKVQISHFHVSGEAVNKIALTDGRVSLTKKRKVENIGKQEGEDHQSGDNHALSLLLDY
jgi:hypothetical protein